jgi:hypothetical protein
VGFEGVVLVSTEGEFKHAVFAHHELALGEFFFQSLKVVGGHVVPGQNVQVLELGHEGVDFVDDELLVFPLLGLDLGQGHQLVSFCLRHQQLLLSKSLINLLYRLIQIK